MTYSNKQAHEILARKLDAEKKKNAEKLSSIYAEIIENTKQDIENMKSYVNMLNQLISKIVNKITLACIYP